MINQRSYDKFKFHPYPYGWTIGDHRKEHDFSIRCVCSVPGPAEIFDQSLNSNYLSIIVLNGFDKEEIRKNFEQIVWTADDFENCTTMNFYDKELLQAKYENVINNTSNVTF